MKPFESVLMVAVLGFGFFFVYERTQRTDAEDRAQESAELADAALSVAEELRDSLEVVIARSDTLEEAYGDSLIIWGARAAQANERAQNAVRAAEAAAEIVVASADSATVEAFNVYRRERDAEVEAERELRVIAERQVNALEVRVSTLTTALDLARQENEEVRAAANARLDAMEALESELGRRKRQSWLERGVVVLAAAYAVAR